jgi:uncharacterized membrane protein
MQQDQTASAPRIPAIDLARGVALVGMVFYHLSWDFAYFHLAPSDFPAIPPMRLFSHIVAAAFLMLAGASLALAHPGGFVRWRPFWRRLAIVGGAAALLTAATFMFAPEDAIFFGILHCIALASLIAAPLLLAPVWVGLALSALVFAAPFVSAGPMLNASALIWIGLGSAPPRTLDWRPLLPWSGFVFLGLSLARMNFRRMIGSKLARWRPAGRIGRSLAWAGRHSLAIYLVHQPILFPLLFAAVDLTGFEAAWEAEQFANVCQRECVAGGGEPEVCAPACQCVMRGLRAAGLSGAIAHGPLDDAQSRKYSSVVQACSAGPKGSGL